MSYSPRRAAMAASLLVVGLTACARSSTPAVPVAEEAVADTAPTAEHVVPLALPSGVPDHFRLALPLGERAETVVLDRHAVRAPGAQLFVYRAEGTMPVQPWPEVATYRGRLEGRPDLTVLASLTPDGLHATIVDAREVLWRVRPAAAGPGSGLHEIHAGSPPDEPPLECGYHAGLGVAAAAATAAATAPIDPVPAQTCQHLAEIAFDADYEFFLAQGGTVPAVVARIEDHMNLVDFFYARDVEITHRVTAIVVRTAPFYDPTDGGNLLDLFTAEWNDNMGHIERDLAHLMTGKSGSLLGYGGLAWVGTVCSWLQYAWSMDSANIVGHEIGHNWGAGHCHDVDPCNNMCGGCFYIAPLTKDIIIAHRDSRPCLDAWRPYDTQVPPYAHPDGVKVRKDQFPALVDLHLDVLANDHDGNCVPVGLEGHDATTPRGGTLTTSLGTGPDGRDELVYDPPAAPFLGEDNFAYVAGDGAGAQEAGEVTIEVQSIDLAGWWTLDEGAGAAAGDETAHGRDGVVDGGAAWTTGPFGGALALDGVDDHVDIPALELRSNTITIAARIRRHGPQNVYAGIVFCRGGNTAAGLNFRSGDALGYHWNGTGSGWSTGLMPPDNQWVFVALVIEPDAARIHMHDGTTMQVATNVAPHGPEEFDAPLTLGLDDNGLSRYAAIDIDDVRVYPIALTAAEIDALVDGEERAQAPHPEDGGRMLPDAPQLSWAAGHLALSHDVYFGTGWDAVRTATSVDPEFQGNQLATTFAPAAIAYDTTYFWRVDEVTGSGVVTGDVWQFAAADYHHWRLDETTGTTAAEERFGRDGTYLGGALLGEPGATATTGTGVFFDGTNDLVEVSPALALASNHLTITGWLRRDGAQIADAGVVFCRGGTTAAGVSFFGAGQLGYQWNDEDAAATWASGLVVPDQTWVFFALVVEPQRATLYLGDGGVLSSAEHVMHHAPEAFDGTLDFARNKTTPARRFAGHLDDVRVHHAAMTPAQVDALYRSY